MLLRLALLFALALSLQAEGKPAPTVEQLQAQIAAKDQQIVQLQRQITETQRDTFLYRQSFNGCLDRMDQQQQIRQPSRPAPVKPEAK